MLVFHFEPTARSLKLCFLFVLIAAVHTFAMTFSGPYMCQLFGVILSPDALTVADCQAACNLVPTCSGIAFVPDEGPCYFYDTSATLVPEPNTFDGCLEYIRDH